MKSNYQVCEDAMRVAARLQERTEKRLIETRFLIERSLEAIRKADEGETT